MNNFISEVCIKWQKDLDNAILGEIKRKAIEHGIKTEYLLNEKAIISALEKQIPKKPIITAFNVYCPQCNHDLGKDRAKREALSNFKCFCYCSACGQALDWGDTE